MSIKAILFSLFCYFCLSVSAQEESVAVLSEDSVVAVELSALEPHQFVFTNWSGGLSPFHYSDVWMVHEGLNAQVDAGVAVGWGKGNPFRGGSFFTDVSLLYTLPLGKRWTVAAGGTLSRFKMWSNNMVAGSVQGSASYQFNDRLTGTVYGAWHKMLTPMEGRSGAYPFLDRCTEIGAGLSYKFNNDVQLSVTMYEVVGGRHPWEMRRGGLPRRDGRENW